MEFITKEVDKAYGVSHKGKRENNEDNILVEKINDIYLLAVADGLGGHNAGEVASKIATETLREVFLTNNEDIESLLIKAYEEAHKRILEEAVGDKEGMGTTLTTAVIRGDKCYIANCGDSRAYLIRNGEIVFKTKDHSLVQALIDNGIISEEEALTHPMKNIISHALGVELKVDLYNLELKEGDLLLLSSDGLHDYVREREILDVIREKKEVKEIVNSLLELALEKTKDNVSIIVYKH
ncbi:protein serine/threonine phosphatase [Methanocaldococcus infernus ME]|uniref:Protein serine/threonine phosphatase n=1 Tax=Methanocaldococcus infernus (strain DSM 11812 / JCM 15783 / ME) TaxID=573063 RepID=D5VTX5_METIM|nr:Stp1/IreP family PP2C-type Ser/Thr phosphatase [Methanocaldococcus infernus]ADG14028.1 protein serine/threonine phosphatase [Methanocaldococcus infernus ME]